MTKRAAGLVMAAGLLLLGLMTSLAVGEVSLPPRDVLSALIRFDDSQQSHYIVIYQRLPRALIAIFAGATTAMSGAMLQGLLRNPLASPSLLGVSGGAALFTVAGVFFLNLGLAAQGVAALAGGGAGFAATVAVARMVGLRNDPRGLALILSGAIVSIFCTAAAQAVLLSDPLRRSDMLSWLTGNINHAYFPRLEQFWWIGVLGMIAMLALARSATLVAFGADKAASLGINVGRVRMASLTAAVLASAAAVAVCGPVGFVGLIVPHLVRPFTGFAFPALLTGSALLGAAICLGADLLARILFAPHVPSTGVIMELIGGLVFIVIVRRFYLSPAQGGRA